MANPFEGGKSPGFRITKDFHNFCQSFGKFGETQKEKGETYPLFRKYTHIFTLCATIGYYLGTKIPLEGKLESPFTLEQIGEKEEWPTLIAIAWSDSNKDTSIFVNSRKIVEICEEYAEAGFRFLIQQPPFKEIYVDNCTYNLDKIDLEYRAMLLVEELKREFSKAIA